jgi:hypothetical protein
MVSLLPMATALDVLVRREFACVPPLPLYL